MGKRFAAWTGLVGRGLVALVVITPIAVQAETIDGTGS